MEAIWTLYTMEVTKHFFLKLHSFYVMLCIIHWGKSALNPPSSSLLGHQGAPVARAQHCWTNVTSVVTIVLFLYESRTDKPRGALTFNVNVWWTSEAFHFNVHTRALKKKPKKKFFAWLLCRSSAGLLCHVNSNNKTMFAIELLLMWTHLWTWILHWLKNWSDPFIARIVYRFVRMCAANSRWGKNLNSSDREKACGQPQVDWSYPTLI